MLPPMQSTNIISSRSFTCIMSPLVNKESVYKLYMISQEEKGIVEGADSGMHFQTEIIFAGINQCWKDIFYSL